MKNWLKHFSKKETSLIKHQNKETSRKMIGTILRLSILLMNVGIFQINNSMYLRNVGVMAAVFSEPSEDKSDGPSMEGTGLDVDTDQEEKKPLVFEFIFLKEEEASEIDSEEMNVTNINDRYGVADENTYLFRLCNGTHEIPQHATTHSNQEFINSNENKIECSEKIPMDDHFLLEIHDLSYHKDIIRFNTLLNIVKNLKLKIERKVFLHEYIVYRNFKYIIKLSDSQDDSFYDIPLNCFRQIIDTLNFLDPEPSKNLDEFLTKFYSKTKFFYKNREECFRNKNSPLLNFFSDYTLRKCYQTEDEAGHANINDGFEETKQDSSGINSTNTADEFMLKKYCYDWPLGAYLSRYNLSLQYTDGVVTVEKKTTQVFTRDLAGKLIADNFYFRLIKGSFFRFNHACIFDENIVILSFFFRKRNILGLELSDLEYEPTIEERHPEHDHQIIKNASTSKNIEFPPENDTRQAVFNLMKIIPAFREIKTLKIKNVELDLFDLNALSDLQSLTNLEITSSKEIERILGKIILKNKSLKNIVLESVILEENFFDSLKLISPEVLVLKNCKPPKECQVLNFQSEKIFSLFSDQASIFASKLHKFEIVGEKNIDPNFLKFLKKLKVLKLISCFDKILSQEYFGYISKIQDLEELNLSGNEFYSYFNVKIFSKMTSLSKLELEDCGIDFSSTVPSNLDKKEFKCALKELNLSKNKSENVFLFVNCFPGLEVLDLSEFCVEGNPNRTNQVEVSLPENLKVLKLKKLKNSFFKKFKIQFHKKVESLYLRDSIWDCRSSPWCFISTKTLLKLDLSFCTLSATDVNELKCLDRLTHLFLYDTEFQDLDLYKFLDLISARYLEEIYISKEDLKITNVRLMTLLKKFSNLKKIFLYSVVIPEGSFDREELDQFCNLKLFFVGYVEKNAHESETEIEILNSYFKPGIVKTFKINATNGCENGNISIPNESTS
ncbi:hypothetical protein CWI39_0270p0010 [Hamiltosporidium magnivora]|uniref:Leucine-rich repeat-containing protein n=1 Tax=Hamiltosporidium magnivora TaxID=148818 RepID=A0A4Q9LIH8_9MICR|nr:hypothetical protein CWI39_0270p0010 [Hamiltosporidium magnivora]